VCVWMPGHMRMCMLTRSAASEGAGEGGGFGKMFADPNLLGKLAANPRTAKHLADPGFMQKAPPALSARSRPR
jgi:hypothetical protein